MLLPFYNTFFENKDDFISGLPIMDSVDAIMHEEHGLIGSIRKPIYPEGCEEILVKLNHSENGVLVPGDFLASMSEHLPVRDAYTTFISDRIYNNSEPSLEDLEEDEELLAEYRKLREPEGPLPDPMGYWSNNPYVLAIRCLSLRDDSPYDYLARKIDNDEHLRCLAIEAVNYRITHPHNPYKQDDVESSILIVAADLRNNGVLFDDRVHRVLRAALQD